MTKLTLEQQELLFANDCKLINLRYEYHGYTGTEKWAIVTELAEEELWVKYLNSEFPCNAFRITGAALSNNPIRLLHYFGITNIH